MSYLETIRTLGPDAEQLEKTYAEALKQGEGDTFAAAITTQHDQDPANLLYAAWYYRLAQAAVARGKEWAIAWGWAIPLAVLNGLLFWWLSDLDRFMLKIVTNYMTGIQRDLYPVILLVATPIAALFVLIYLLITGRERGKERGRALWPRLLGVAIGLVAVSAYVLWVYPQSGSRPYQEQYMNLMLLHLPLLAWAAVGIVLLTRNGDAENRFAFLIKSLEVFIMGGLFVIAGGLFTAITIGLFDALGIQMSELAQRLFIAGGGGLLPVLAVAVIYNPQAAPGQQSFDEGLSKMIALLMRLMLPLTLLVLVVYIGFIPFNFRQPFENRDVLIAYNGMLFAVMALLMGATPLRAREISPRVGAWLRRGLILLAALAALVSLYALAAILYRTLQDRLTPNRLVFIGWNIVNLGILALVLFKQLKRPGQGSEHWLARLHSAIAAGAVAYVVWALVVVLVTPWLFRLNSTHFTNLPPQVQQLVYENAYPVLLKCSLSPNIYLLDQGEKHWVKDIDTFNAEGYQWRDVQMASCDSIDAILLGAPIPPDAGLPPD